MGRDGRGLERVANGAALALIGLLWLVLAPPAAVIAGCAGLFSLLKSADVPRPGGSPQ